MTATTRVNETDKSAAAAAAAATAKGPRPIGSDLSGDWLNFFLLILLYVMQGMPLGLASAVPILLQSKKNVTYKDQVITYLLITDLIIDSTRTEFSFRVCFTILYLLFVDPRNRVLKTRVCVRVKQGLGTVTKIIGSGTGTI